MTASAIPVPPSEYFEQDLESDYGLVSPEGVFYSCEFWGHSALARKLGAYDYRGSFKPGWIHVAGESWDFDNPREEMNQKQIECAWAWVRAASWRSLDRVMKVNGK